MSTDRQPNKRLESTMPPPHDVGKGRENSQSVQTLSV